MRFFFSLLLMGVVTVCQAQYSVADIDPILFENANAVIRSDEAKYEVLTSGSGKYTYSRIVTILNENGDWFAGAVVGYDKLSKARFTKANIYDALGKRVYKLKKSDIIDQSSISGFSIYEDNRLKYLNLSRTTYPYTVEYEYEVSYDFLYSIPNWYVVPRQFTSIENSSYTVIAPRDLRPRYKNFNVGESNFKESLDNEQVIYEWTFSKVSAIEREPFGPAFNEQTPIVYLAPSKFEFDNYSGDMSSWDGIAAWQRELNKGREELPVETIKEIVELTKLIESDRDKIRVVYEYLQSNTRYVSIQLGIGGFQPFEAKVVDDLGYGDCKALSFYTQSLLKTIGINSYYTWVEADDDPRPVFKDFPNDTFNHIILCVPNKGDTVWLECTSQVNPFGYMGSFTGDRDVLLVTEDAGKIVHTPVYDESVNTQVRTAEMVLTGDGNGEVQVSTSFMGLKYEYDGLNFIVGKGDVDQKKWIVDNTQLPNFELKSYNIEAQKNPIPEAKVTSTFSTPKYARKTGKRLFFGLNLMNRIERIPRPVNDRQTDFIQKQAYTEIDSIVYSFDKSFKFEYIPTGEKIESKFGEYESQINQEEGKIIFVRKYRLKKGRYTAEDYEAFRDFQRKIVKADAAKVVLNGTT